VRDFTVAIPQADVDDLRARLRRTRFLADIDNDNWRYGVSTAFLEEVVGYWAGEYDWRAIERDVLNAFPQYIVELDGRPIHFLHVRGDGPDPVPIVLCHGWPWTPWDFKKVIGPLADPGAHGGDPADAFDVVVPSLPGFGFSSPVTKTGATPLVTAGLFVQLMREVLGYGRFGASGSDWGAFVAAYLAHAHADEILGAHMTFPALLTRYEIKPEDYGPDEQGRHERMKERLAALPGSHVAPHVGDPQTLGHALNDSPAGLAAWMLRIRRDGAHIKDGNIASRYTMDELCTLPSVYWFTQSIGTSMRFYSDTLKEPLSRASGRGAWDLPLVHDRKPTLQAPTAISVFAYEPIQIPRKIAEQHANLQQFTFHEEGGHFAAHEEPERWVDDVRAFFRTFR
jgi:pimeloyl-ACP methyl ester carboxylesterase